ncbi:MAG: molybdenum cofactor guanylyltransferase [bacterium]
MTTAIETQSKTPLRYTAMDGYMDARILGAILAGGRSTRMNGLNKGLLERAPGTTAVEYLADEMREAGLEKSVISVNDETRYAELKIPTIPDLRPGLGPLAGVEAVLDYIIKEDRADAALFLPCDMPAITRSEIRALLDAFKERSAVVVTALIRTERDKRYPICCVVHREALPRVSTALDEERLKVGQLWTDLKARDVVFYDAKPFANINTPEEYESFRKRGI